MKQIIYRKESVLVEDLINSKRCEIFESLYENPFYYSNEAKLFQHYELPVVTPDHLILSHMEDVIAAHANQIEFMDVIVADGLDEDSILRFIFKSIYFKKLNTEAKGKLITILTDYLNNNPAGQVWSAELEARQLINMDEKLGEILTCHKETVKYNKRVNELYKRKGTKIKYLIPKIEIKNLNISMEEDSFKIEYKGKEASLQKSDYRISQQGDYIIVRMPMKKISIFQAAKLKGKNN